MIQLSESSSFGDQPWSLALVWLVGDKRDDNQPPYPIGRFVCGRLGTCFPPDLVLPLPLAMLSLSSFLDLDEFLSR